MSVYWVRLQSPLCGHGDHADEFDSGSGEATHDVVMCGLTDGSNWRPVMFLRRGRMGGWRRATGAAAVCLGWILALQGTMSTAGCSHAGLPAPANLLERFVPVMQVAGRGSYQNPIVVDRAGSKKVAMVLVAPAAAKASLEGWRGPVELQLMVVPVFNVGDGIQMEIWLRDDELATRVYGRCFDPACRFEDRRWTPVVVAMDVHRKDAQLEIRVTGGPVGNLTGDWLAFADARISRKAEAR